MSYNIVKFMDKLLQLKKDLKKAADPQRAKNLLRFFKTGKGEYGEGDVFLGIMVPQSRKIAIKFKDLNFISIETLLKSKFHEERLVALLILVHNFEKGDDGIRKQIYDFYLNNTKHINNWDLVDLSAPNIVGAHLLDKGRGILHKLVKSKNIWGRRIAVLATFQFIKHNQFNDSLKLAEMLLEDKHDLIHKAVGWMLREVGKRDFKVEDVFLRKYCKQMPRTMLRYAIERFPKAQKAAFLKR